MSKESTRQKPVAWVEAWANGQVQVHEENCFSDDPVWLSNPIPLYTSPQKREWAGLTDEEFVELCDKDLGTAGLIKAVEDKMRQKNT